MVGADDIVCVHCLMRGALRGASCQVAVRRNCGRWHLSDPLCDDCAGTYGVGAGTHQFDAREVLAL